MTYNLFFIADAEKDLFEIYEYIKKSGHPMNAKNLVSLVRGACSNLSEFPERGRAVPELVRIGVSGYRELIIQVYRIIYEIDGKNVYIHCILDGRRDIQNVLGRRMLR